MGVAAFVPQNSNFDVQLHAASWSGNSVSIERALDGTNFYPVSEDAAGTPATYTQDFNGVLFEPNPNVKYRLNCTLWASTISYVVK